MRCEVENGRGVRVRIRFVSSPRSSFCNSLCNSLRRGLAGGSAGGLAGGLIRGLAGGLVGGPGEGPVRGRAGGLAGGLAVGLAGGLLRGLVRVPKIVQDPVTSMLMLASLLKAFFTDTRQRDRSPVFDIVKDTTLSRPCYSLMMQRKSRGNHTPFSDPDPV